MGHHMQSLLLYSDRENVLGTGYSGRENIVNDLNLNLIFQAACRPVWKEGDSLTKAEKEDFFIYDTMKRIMLVPLQSAEEIGYRHTVIKEILARPKMTGALYQLASRAGALLDQNKERAKEKRGGSQQSSGNLLGTYELLCRLLELLEELRGILAAEEFSEESALSALKTRIDTEYSETFRNGLKEIIQDMEFFTTQGSMIVSMRLGAGMKESELLLKKIRSLEFKEKDSALKETTDRWFQKLFATNTVTLKEEKLRREAGMLREEAFRYVLGWLEPVCDDLVGFFENFHQQIAFYNGCLQLKERMESFGAGYCFPEVLPKETKAFRFMGLYELGMSILTRSVPVSNSLTQEDCWLLVVTGANQGGKSTWLRSLGIAQIMMQCGMFVPAASFAGRIYDNIDTHFTRREDASMNSGRLDEELKRIDGIVRNLTSDSLIFLNESFATTTEKEGSIIAKEFVGALYERGVAVAMVTHLMQFATELYAKQPKHAVFMSAERKEDGTRTFHMVRQTPSETSFGLDLYEDIVVNGNAE